MFTKIRKIKFEDSGIIISLDYATLNSHPTRKRNVWKFVKKLHVKFFPLAKKRPTRRVTVKVYNEYLKWLRITSFVISFVFVSATGRAFSISIPIVIITISYRTVC